MDSQPHTTYDNVGDTTQLLINLPDGQQYSVLNEWIGPSVEAFFAPAVPQTPSQSDLVSPDSTASPLKEGICPFLSDQSSVCSPDKCGVDALCVKSELDPPQIEDCEKARCLERTQWYSGVVSPAQAVLIEMESQQQDASMAFGRDKDKHPIVTVESIDESSDFKARSRSKQAHLLVERKYRENINARFDKLQQALERVNPEHTRHSAGLGLRQPAMPNTKSRKGEILSEALDYIYQAEVDKRHMLDEIARLEGRTPSTIAGPDCNTCALRKQVSQLSLLVR